MQSNAGNQSVPGLKTSAGGRKGKGSGRAGIPTEAGTQIAGGAG